MRKILTALSGTLLLASTSAYAHVTLEVQQARADSTYKAVIRVPHTCGDAPMTTLRVRIPQGMTGVKPMPHAGWNLETVVGPYAEPVTVGDNTISEGVIEVVWSGGRQLNEWYDEFLLRGRLPAGEPGTVIWFPAIQECEGGVADAWIQMPEPGQSVEDFDATDPETPAPRLTLTE